MNKANTIRFHATLNRLGLLGMKHELLFNFSSGAYQSSKDVPDSEMERLMAFVTSGQTDDADRLRKKILSTCHQLGWYQHDAEGTIILKRNKPVLDIKRIDRFCTEHGVFHKLLNEHTAAELSKLIYQFNQILKHTT